MNKWYIPAFSSENIWWMKRISGCWKNEKCPLDLGVEAIEVSDRWIRFVKFKVIETILTDLAFTSCHWKQVNQVIGQRTIMY